MNPIFHLSTTEDHSRAQTSGLYTCASLHTEGFIHCCLPAQLAGVAERYYSNLAGLELLLIDPTKLLAPIVYENTVGGDELFPHVYGEINLTAVIQVLPFELNVHYGVLQASSD